MTSGIVLKIKVTTFEQKKQKTIQYPRAVMTSGVSWRSATARDVKKNYAEFTQNKLSKQF